MNYEDIPIDLFDVKEPIEWLKANPNDKNINGTLPDYT